MTFSLELSAILLAPIALCRGLRRVGCRRDGTRATRERKEVLERWPARSLRSLVVFGGKLESGLEGGRGRSSSTCSNSWLGHLPLWLRGTGMDIRRPAAWRFPGERRGLSPDWGEFLAVGSSVETGTTPLSLGDCERGSLPMCWGGLVGASIGSSICSVRTMLGARAGSETRPCFCLTLACW